MSDTYELFGVISYSKQISCIYQQIQAWQAWVESYKISWFF